MKLSDLWFSTPASHSNDAMIALEVSPTNVLPERMQREHSVKLLRWICVLPAAVLAGFAAQYFGSKVGHYATYGWGAVSESNIALVIGLLPYAIAAGTFVLAGAFTAPLHHRPTSLMLAIVGTNLSFFKHIQFQPHPGGVNYLHVAAETTGAVLAVAYMLHFEKRRGRVEQPRVDATS